MPAVHEWSSQPEDEKGNVSFVDITCRQNMSADLENHHAKLAAYHVREYFRKWLKLQSSEGVVEYVIAEGHMNTQHVWQKRGFRVFKKMPDRRLALEKVCGPFGLREVSRKSPQSPFKTNKNFMVYASVENLQLANLQPHVAPQPSVAPGTGYPIRGLHPNQ